MTKGGNEMADLTPDEIKEGRWMLGGPRIIFWISLIVVIIGTISAIVSFFTGFFGLLTDSGNVLTFLSSIGSLVFSILWVILYWVELAGMSKGRPYAVGLGRFLIIWMMIFTFPIGTIIGAIIWKRFSHPAAQKYLNYA